VYAEGTPSRGGIARVPDETSAGVGRL
jgi:hypothetical protein